MIEVENLTKTFQARIRVLDDLSFTVKDGDVFGLLGPNGAGKTTTIRVLCGILAPTAGEVRVDGRSVSRDPASVKRCIGLMPEEVEFYPDLTAKQHLMYYASFYGIDREHAIARARALLQRLGLKNAATVKVRAYSHGMRRRLALAQCLLHDPSHIILDEPLSGLDPEGVQFVRSQIQMLKEEGWTILLSSHLLHEVQRICNRVGIINHGRLIAVGSAEMLARRLHREGSTELHFLVDSISTDVLSALREVRGVESVRRLPGGIAVNAAAGVEVAPAVNRLLVQSGIGVYELRRHEAGLEELFLAFTRSEET